ncbi:hypothetical protein DC347_12170 [Pseudarthrobacter sp. AG30]|uniref:hypothetical protein n=1 Tax=Pseudarthrobacter sp. AG30 TaxID=2249742 RepID=UPI000D64B525|nr:hypothetical protein [Pseudarthrobacter sp. AG30]RAX16549.1 hypothetical protein DC347_12170 [Pseudarthrobacter sp. AG30]
MTIKLNDAGLRQARKLIKDSRIARDARDDWSEHAPDTEQENAYIDKHGYTEYGTWHLGEDSDKTPETKGRYSFPFGDFRRLHRCAVLAIESRAAQNNYDDIAKAAKSLLEELDKD